jgi:lysophospholipase L1-like esterase
VFFAIVDAATGQNSVDLKYSFGAGAVSGFTRVKSDSTYSTESGFGYDLETKVKVTPGSVTGEKGRPILFSAKVPEGAYQVTVTLGNPTSDSTTTIKSETRRLMLEDVHVAAGKTDKRSFLVHVRRPEYPGGSVAFKDREKLPILYVQWDDKSPLIPFTELDWDEKLTLEFSEPTAAVVSVEITSAPAHTTIYLVGDSTMTDHMMEPYAAWGQMFPRFFKSPVLIANYAECGESAASFIGERRWPKVMSEIHPGDFVLIQMGINDGGLAEDRIRQYFGQFIDDARKKGAIPVLVTSQNLERRQIGNYAEVMRKIAKEQDAPLIDLNAMSVKLYEAIGADNLHNKFFIDGTHHSDYGAYELAKCVVQGVIDAKLPWAQHVVDDWKSFDPSHPDAVESFHMQQDPQLDPARRGGPGAPDNRGPMAGAVQGARRGGPASRPATQGSTQ